MSDERRIVLAVVCFLVGGLLTTVSVIAGAVFMVLGLAALLWGRSIGDNRPPRP